MRPLFRRKYVKIFLLLVGLSPIAWGLYQTGMFSMYEFVTLHVENWTNTDVSIRVGTRNPVRVRKGDSNELAVLARPKTEVVVLSDGKPLDRLIVGDDLDPNEAKEYLYVVGGKGHEISLHEPVNNEFRLDESSALLWGGILVEGTTLFPMPKGEIQYFPSNKWAVFTSADYVVTSRRTASLGNGDTYEYGTGKYGFGNLNVENPQFKSK